MNSFLKEIDEVELNSSIKGIPFVKNIKLKNIKKAKLNIIKENVQFPILTLDKNKLENNINILKSFAKRNSLNLAPHCKTFMSPQIINEYFRNDWGVTISNNQQLSSIVKLNLKNIIYGNLIINRENLIQYLKICKKYKNISNIYYCIDSSYGLKLLMNLIETTNYKNDIKILIELGFKNGRCGIRDFDSFKKILKIYNRKISNITISGLFFYEGAIASNDKRVISNKIENIIKLTKLCHEELIRENLYKNKNNIITAGGSVYFDLVTKYYHKYSFTNNPKLIIRPGSFIAYGHGYYEKKIDDIKKRKIIKKYISSKENIFLPSLLIWSHVISINDDGKAIINFGKRDVSFDLGNPIPISIYRKNNFFKKIKNDKNLINVYKLNDQHAFLKYHKSLNLKIGDLISFGVSHPCITFDKWKYFYMINSKTEIINIYKTFF